MRPHNVGGHAATAARKGQKGIALVIVMKVRWPFPARTECAPATERGMSGARLQQRSGATRPFGPMPRVRRCRNDGRMLYCIVLMLSCCVVLVCACQSLHLGMFQFQTAQLTWVALVSSDCLKERTLVPLGCDAQPAIYR